MTPEELRLRRIAGFRDLASSELEAAKLLAEAHRGQAAYFLQQCVEKLVRGILEVEAIKVGPTHNILQLAQLIEKHRDLADRFKALDELSAAATRYRYPGPDGGVRSISRERLDRLLTTVDRLNEDVRSILAGYLRNRTTGIEHA